MVKLVLDITQPTPLFGPPQKWWWICYESILWFIYNEDFEIAHTGTDFADFAIANPARYNSKSGHRAGNGGHFYHATSYTGQTITHIVTVGDNGTNKLR